MNDALQEYFNKWLSGLENEIEYWKLYMEEQGGVSFYGYEEMISSDKRYVLEDDIPSSYYGKEYKFLDVGAGPFSRCGRITDKVKLDALAVDPLASIYNVLKEKNSIDNGIKLETGFVELLNKKFRKNTFDVVHMSNSLDHCFDAVYGIYQLLFVCKIGGKVILRHSENEAEKARYTGLHQWNLSLHNTENTFLIWRDTEKYDILKLFQDFADIKLYPDLIEGLWKYNKVVMIKRKDIVLPSVNYCDEMFQCTYEYLLNHLLQNVKKSNRKPMSKNELACKKIIETYNAPKRFIEKLQAESINCVDIYGIGEVGSSLYHLLEKCNIQIDQIIDREQKLFRGKKTVSLENYTPRTNVSKVIVTVCYDRHIILEKLAKKVNKKNIMVLDDFLGL